MGKAQKSKCYPYVYPIFFAKVKCYPYVYPIIDYNIELQYKWIQLKPVLNLKGDLNHDRIFENLRYAAH